MKSMLENESENKVKVYFTIPIAGRTAGQSNESNVRTKSRSGSSRQRRSGSRRRSGRKIKRKSSVGSRRRRSRRQSQHKRSDESI